MKDNAALMPAAHKYKRIAESLRQRIRSGRYDAGARLPTSKMLALEYDVTAVTIDRAIALLVHEGLLIRTPGVGTSVVQPERVRPATDEPVVISALMQAQTDSGFWERLIEGVNDILRPAGIAMLIGYHQQDRNTAREHAELFAKQKSSLCLFAPFDRPDKLSYEADNADMIEELRSMGMEVILLDRYVETVPTHYVSEYCFSPGVHMIEQTAAMGYTNPVCFSTDYVSVIDARERAFVEGCRAAGIRDPESRIVRLPLSTYQTRDYDAITAALVANSDADLIVSMNSRIFNTVMYTLNRRNGKPVPVRPRFAGFVDVELIDLENVIAYVEQPVREMGHAAGRLVQHLLTDDSVEYRHSLIPCELRILGDDE
ncbi:MAG: GntR family transcriptional regulator [bacterium]